MNWPGLISVLMGVFYLIYAVLCRDTVTVYNRTRELKLLKLREFLRLQLIFSIVNSIYLIIYGIIIILFRLNHAFIVLGILPFHCINLLLLMKSKEKGYIDYKVMKTYK